MMKLYIIILISIIIIISLVFYYTKKINIINLVLYSNSDEYDLMYNLTRNYYKKFTNVKTIYYKFNETIISDYVLENDILHIKGKETYVPGILDKTIKAFEYVNNFEFDYVIRSNISTIINFDLLTKYLTNNKIEYGGGFEFTLENIDKQGGIVDETYFGTKYASGTSIILSKKTLNEIVNKKSYVNYSIIDDVAFAILIDQLNIEKKYIPKEYFIFVPDEHGDMEKIKNVIKDKSYIFYRNRNSDRKTDVAQMKTIIDYLM